MVCSVAHIRDKLTDEMNRRTVGRMKKSVHTLPLTLKIANDLSLPIRQAHPWIQLGNTIGACTSAALYHPVQITVSASRYAPH